MNKTEIVTLAREKMNEHGFGHIPFQWGRGKRTLGKVNFQRNRTGVLEPILLSLSELVVPHLTNDDVRDLILHEIAHLIAGHEAGHGRAWKAACRRIGAKPNRTTDAVPQYVQERLSNYTLVCESCGTETYLYRTPKRGLNSYRHTKCGGSFRPK